MRIFQPQHSGANRHYWFFITAIFLACITAASGAAVSYRISIPQPQTHLIQVEMTLDGARGDEVVGLPVWTPGSYLVREFERHVQDVSATGYDEQPLPIQKIDKNHWQINGNWHTKQIIIRYRVYAFEPSVRTSFVNAGHALLNGASVFMYWQNHLDVKHAVSINLPAQWSVISTSLEPFAIPGNRTFQAADYDELVDSPLELGNQHEINFAVDGKPHVIALDGTSNYEDSVLVRDFTKIIKTEKEVWGEIPYDHYVFIFHLGNGGGGLEHQQSSVMFARRWSFTDTTAYHRFLALVAHEFFHTWNIKRLRPTGLGPFDYDRETFTKNLWVVEGLTSYYAELILLRAGFYEPDDYLGAVTGQINRLEERPGRLHQSLSEAGWDAWIKYYRPDEHSANNTISYYNKGALVGLLLNLKIMVATNGKNGLDDVLRYLYQHHFKQSDVPYTAADVRAAAEKISGLELKGFFDNYVAGTAALPYAGYLRLVGLQLDTTASDSSAWLGIEAQDSDGRFVIRRVIEDTPAGRAGLNVNDELIALDGFRVNQFPPAYLRERQPGDRITVTVSREGLLQEIPVSLGAKPANIKQLSRIENPTGNQKKLYELWLGMAWPSENDQQ